METKSTRRKRWCGQLCPKSTPASSTHSTRISCLDLDLSLIFLSVLTHALTHILSILSTSVFSSSYVAVLSADKMSFIRCLSLIISCLNYFTLSFVLCLLIFIFIFLIYFMEKCCFFACIKPCTPIYITPFFMDQKRKTKLCFDDAVILFVFCWLLFCFKNAK